MTNLRFVKNSMTVMFKNVELESRQANLNFRNRNEKACFSRSGTLSEVLPEIDKILNSQVKRKSSEIHDVVKFGVQIAS